KEGIFTASDVSEDTVPGRFNANEVDLNRNFDCKWSADGVWRGNKVNTGEGPFSEKESQVIRDYVLEIEPKAVIFWHSQAGAVYGSECFSGILPDTLNIMNLYAKAAGYDAVPFFDAYPVHGDSEGWLASIDIPAITVELQTHSDVEFDRNIKGLKALLEYYKN
ncbi:MAG: M14 family metallopeptidase, partial [Candidatus Pacebacteria bacterium]|nr:M14 family metallopeptidase [Candidatus Paceibacterota bacterium]